jgi:hypothetical protein
MKKLLLSLILIFSLGASSVLSAGPQPLGNYLLQGDTQDPVEQLSPDWKYASNGYNNWQCTHDGTFEEYQAGAGTEHPDNCIHNPWRAEHCTWDVDDHAGISDWGYLNSGVTIIYPRCYVADSAGNHGGDDKIFDVFVWAPSKNLNVQLTDTLGNVYTPTPVANGNGWAWIICAREHLNGPFALIPNSNGGIGLRVDGNLTITATKKTNGVVVYFSTWGWLREFSSITNCTYP